MSFPMHRRAGIRVAGAMDQSRAAAIPAGTRAQAGEDRVAESFRTAFLGFGVRLFAGSVCTGTDSLLELAVPESGI